MKQSFNLSLLNNIKRFGPLCVGIDPHPSLIKAWNLSDNVSGIEKFSFSILNALGNMVPVFKIQVAFYERFGSYGLKVLEKLLSYTKKSNLLVIADVKRNDIDSTMKFYSQAWLSNSSPLSSDAITLNPYLGLSSIKSAIVRARKLKKGTFIIIMPSNSDTYIQNSFFNANKKNVASYLMNQIRKENYLYNNKVHKLDNSIGIVFGATKMNKNFIHLQKNLIDHNGFILAPGIGAQGANDINEIKKFLLSSYSKVLFTSSRDIIKHGPSVKKMQLVVKKIIHSLTN